MGILRFSLLFAALLSAACAETVECKGLIVPQQQARIASRAQGVIAMIKDEGEVVKKGDAIMELENEMEQLQVEQAKHVLELREFEWKSVETLRAKEAVSKTEGEEKRIALQVAKSQLAQAEQLLARRRVLAPFDGAVSERMREVGEAVDEFIPVLVFVHLDTVYLDVYLPAARFQQLKEGQAVSVLTPDLPGRTFAGKVEKLASVVNAASGEFRVRVAIPNPGHALVAGTYATAKIQLGEPAAAAAKDGAH
jgi:membrane fusion protein, multidrug efflux system